jgi:hypothetical protein
VQLSFKFSLRVGLAEGKVVFYRDLNGAYNVAGGVINAAARVMTRADAGQIMLTEAAYKTLIDFIDDPKADEWFREYRDVPIKHGEKINVYQYLGAADEQINMDRAKHLTLVEQFKSVQDSMKEIFSGNSSDDDENSKTPDQNMEESLNLMKGMVEVLASANKKRRPKVIEAKKGE